MTQTLAKTAIVVSDYDAALQFYVGKLGFTCTEDTDLGDGKRWVTVTPPGGQGAQLLLARAVTDDQRRCIGNQTGGRVFLFIETDDIDRDVEVYRSRGVRFAREPEQQPRGQATVSKPRVIAGVLDRTAKVQKPSACAGAVGVRRAPA